MHGRTKLFKSRLHVRTRRTLWCALAIMLTMLTVLSARFFATASFTTSTFDTYVVQVGRGELELGWNNKKFDEDIAVDNEVPSFTSGWKFNFDRTSTADEISLAWRPYHSAAGHFPQESDYHFFTFPLWIAVVILVCIAGYMQGVVVGLRRGSRGNCSNCGYNRFGLSASAPCPECGASSVKL